MLDFSDLPLAGFIFVSGCWNRPVVVAATFSARPRRRRARVASRPTISPSWARRCSATPTAPTARHPPCHRAPTSPVMIHTNACLAPPMPPPPSQMREITCAAISFPSAGDRRSRRCRRRRLRRARPAATAIRHRASLTALPATAASTISQVRAPVANKEIIANYPGTNKSIVNSFSIKFRYNDI